MRARRATLGLTLAAAVLGTAAGQVGGSHAAALRALAFGSALAVALIPVAGRGAPTFDQWTRARSVSEALKAEVYTHLAGVAPYRGADAGMALLHRADQILSDAGDLTALTAGLEAVRRSLPDVSGLPSYVAVRVLQQVSGYYRPKAQLMRRRVGAVRQAEVILGVVSAVLAAATAALGTRWTVAWVGVVTTIAAAVAADAAASRFDYQRLEFARTADELERLVAVRAATAGTRTPQQDDEFVAACEEIISIQNDGWMVKLRSPAE